MNPNLNWQKIRSELNKLSDVEFLKSELQKVGKEIKKIDLKAKLGPKAQQNLNKIEKKYNSVMQTITKAQRQIDRDFNKVARALKNQKMTTQQKIDLVRKMALEHKSKLKNTTRKVKTRTTTKSKARKSKATKRS